MDTNRLEELKKYLAESPDDIFIQYAIAMELKEPEPEESLLYLENLLESHPDYLPTYFQAAELMGELDRTDDALEVVKKGIDLATQQSEFNTLRELKNLELNLMFE